MPSSTFRGMNAVTAAVRGTAVAFVLDRVTKTIVAGWDIKPTSSGMSWLITMVHHENHGIIANLPVPQYIIIGATLIVLALVAQALVTSIRLDRWRAAAALGVLIGGALGNLYDRVTLGYVFDWILLFNRSVINLADASIVIGAIWYFVEMRRIDAGNSSTAIHSDTKPSS